MNPRIATAAAFLIAPILPAAILGYVTALDVDSGTVQTTALLVLAYYFYVFIAAVVFGAPAVLIGRHFNLVRWWSASIISALGGAAVVPLITWPGIGSLSSIWRTQSRALEVYSALGALTGLVFWLVWNQGQVKENG